MTSTTPSADEVRALPYQDTAQRAVAALTSGQETFVLTQVAYLTALAFQMGAATADGPPEDPVAVRLAYESGYADGIADGHEGTLADVWEGLRFAFSGPRRDPDHRNGIRGNLTAADALWWHNRAVKQRAEREAADRPSPRDNDYPGGGLGVDWETGRPLAPGEQVTA
ncbi:hypothetical protein GAR05_06126 [Micromonospora saelicesensis]|uniref:Uncharacterized protein n=1 Tax=Micromonospora saelicesensis TaxID=285676 RepID=A0ABX9CAT3_9ACTN|nr:hypothetical protein [Micromonospora saelicesensis]RAN92634.1 hypothetical protein GAR05_06126 [Micromonospora saelicesensis]